MRNRPSPRVAAAVLALGAAVAGCGAPPELDDPPPPRPVSPTPAAPTGGLPTLPTAVPPPGTPGGPGDPGEVAVSCDGDPDDDEVIALLRAEDLLAPGTDPTVTDGPVCAGDWQYAVLSVPDLDPLQVVTRRDGDELELVTAGTDVCSVDVRVHAPPGIRTAAACVG